MSEELKPCPFCGKLPVRGQSDKNIVRIMCGCPKPIGAAYIHWSSLNDWNTRPIEDALRAELAQMRSDNRRMAIRNETMDVALHQIIRWCDAYPVDVFGEPDMDKARKLLEDGGMTLDSVSAYVIRHMVSAFRGYAQAAIFAAEPPEEK